MAVRRELGNKVLLPTSGSRRTLQYFTPFRSLREEKKRAVRTLYGKGMAGSCSLWNPRQILNSSRRIVQAEDTAKYLTAVQRNKAPEIKLQTFNTIQVTATYFLHRSQLYMLSPVEREESHYAAAQSIRG